MVRRERNRRSEPDGAAVAEVERVHAHDGRRLRAALAVLVLAAHGLAAMPAHGQARLDAADIHACMSAAQLVDDLRGRTVSTEVARQRLALIYDIARTSSSSSRRQIAAAYRDQVASANDTLLLVMAEQFQALCR